MCQTTSRPDSNSYTPKLSDRHLRELRDGSGISLAVIADRGSRTVTAAEARACGFADWQARPGLLLPIHGPDGSNGRYQLKPDHPRTHEGKACKYESQFRQPNCLDVPKVCRDRLLDPSVDLFITEGLKKADALASTGKCVIGITGVWNWQKNHKLLPDWDPILPTLDGRRVFVIFDSDAATNPNVRLAEDELAINFLEHRGADAYIIRLPSGPNGTKQGADDFLVAHGAAAFNRLIADTIRAARAEVRQLKAQISARAEMDRNPNLRPAEKLHLAAIFNDTGWRASTGAEAPYAVYRRAIAERTGTSEQSVGSTIDTCSGVGGLFHKRITRTSTPEGEIRSTTHLRPKHQGDVVGMLKAAAITEPDRGDKASWGGKRTPRCPDHPEAALITRLVCSECGQIVSTDIPTAARATIARLEQILNDQDDTSEDESVPPLSITYIDDDLDNSEPESPPPEVIAPLKRGRSHRARPPASPVWECPMCREQMVGGPRCFTHNPTPEQRLHARGEVAP